MPGRHFQGDGNIAPPLYPVPICLTLPHPTCLPCLCRRYVMRCAVPGSGQLGGEEALGVEAEAFACFRALMDERMEDNFSSDSRWA